ncbi:YciI family protein [Streptacidiphilus sp. N1-12]|uniref:YciI family protein n=2 Tax=Streptacidiphilus alkalitolerans TaxID=3342712 RepID=A0ABV6W7D6_9ACTN
MKYMLLMQFSQESAGFPPITDWTKDELQAHIAFMGGVEKRISETGRLIDAQGLDMPDKARIVRAGSSGEPLVTDGPFSETKEFLAGYWVVDLPSPESVYELAAYISTAPGPGGRPLNMPIHVQPVLDAPDLPA